MSQQTDHQAAAKALLLLQEKQAALMADQLAGLRLQEKVRPATPWTAQGIRFEHCIVPALYLTGDSLDYFILADGRIFFYLADVSGSGTAAALISILMKSIIQEFVFSAATATASITPASLLMHINQRLLSYGSGRHVTLICAIIDSSDNSLCWSVGGHLPSPILYSDGQAVFLAGKGQPVGLFEQAQYHNEHMILPNAFSLSLFSDGIFDVLPEDGLVKSEAALPSLVSAAAGNYTELVKRLGLANCHNMPDDIATLVLSRNLA